MVTGYLLCWLPYGVVAMLSSFGQPGTVLPVASLVPSLLAKTSTVLNPIIYVLLNKQVPAALRCFSFLSFLVFFMFLFLCVTVLQMFQIHVQLQLGGPAHTCPPLSPQQQGCVALPSQAAIRETTLCSHGHTSEAATATHTDSCGIL